MSDVIDQTYDLLKSYGLVRSHRQFSSRFMGRSPNYYGAIMAMGRVPAVGSVAALASRVGECQAKVENLARAKGSVDLHRIAITLDQQRERLWEAVEERVGGRDV